MATYAYALGGSTRGKTDLFVYRARAGGSRDRRARRRTVGRYSAAQAQGFLNDPDWHRLELARYPDGAFAAVRAGMARIAGG